MRKLASAYVFLLIGLLLLCWVVPDEVYRIADSMGQRVLYGLAGVRFVLGILLLGAAGSSRMPVFLRVMGVLSISGVGSVAMWELQGHTLRMDIVHHALIGGAGYMVGSAVGEPVVGTAFLAGSVFPDLDVAFIALGKRFYLRNHQGITHSAVMAPLYAAFVSFPLCYFFVDGWDWRVFLAALCGLGIHVLLDWFNTFRIALLLPLSRKRHSLDAVFFVDGVALSLTGSFYLFYGYFDMEFVAYAYPASFVAYFLFKLWIQRRVVAARGCQFAIPSSLNPFEFYVLTKDDDGLRGYLYNCVTNNVRREEAYASVAAEHEALAETSQVFRDMRHITRAFHVTGVSDVDGGTRIDAGDLAVRNFGGKFAKTVLTFDKDGKLIDEVANI